MSKAKLVKIVALEGAKHMEVGKEYSVSAFNAKALVAKKWAKLSKAVDPELNQKK